MTDQTNNNTPVLPELKTYSVQNGEYLYLYAGHYREGANGRRHFVKGPKSAARLKPLDNNNNKYLVVWQDWFLNEHPYLLSYNTYYEPTSTSKFSMAQQPCFSFSAKSGSSHTNSMNRQQFYEAGATWVLDQLLHKSPLLLSLNHKFLKSRLSPELFSLTYFITLTEATNFKDYVRFAGRTRLATQEPFSSADVASFLQTNCSSDLMDFWSELYSRFEKEYASSADFWIIDTAYPNHLIERLSSGEDVPYVEHGKDITYLISRFKRNQLFSEGNSLHCYKRLLQRQPTRIMTVANINNGQAFTFTPYNLEQINSADIVTFIQDCPMWKSQPVVEVKEKPKKDTSNDPQYELLTEEQLRPRLRGVATPFKVTPSVQALHPSNFKVSRATVVINNNISAKERGSKILSRPTSGILPPFDSLDAKFSHYEDLSDSEATDLLALDMAVRAQDQELSEQAMQSTVTSEALISSAGDTAFKDSNASDHDNQAKPESKSDAKSQDSLAIQSKNGDVPFEQLTSFASLYKDDQHIQHNQGLEQNKFVSNEIVTNFDVTQLQQASVLRQQLYEEQLAHEKAREIALQQAQSALKCSINLNGAKSNKVSHGVFVTDRCEHVIEQLNHYQDQHLPFLMQVLPDSELFNMCINKIADKLVQPDNYDAILNRSSITISLIEKPDEYSEILSFIKQGSANGNSGNKSNSRDEVRLKSGRTSAIGSLFSDDIPSASSYTKKNASSKKKSDDGRESKQLRDLLHIKDQQEITPLTLHVCFNYRELIKLSNSLDSHANFDKSETIVEQAEFDMAINSRSNDIKLKRDIVERASGRMGQKPRYKLSNEQIDMAIELDELIQMRNHVVVPEIAKIQRELRANAILDEDDASFTSLPPEVDEWTTDDELELEELLHKLLKTKLPRSVLQISITNSLPKIEDALLACNMLQTQCQLYERLGEDIILQEKNANNVLLSRMPNNSLEQELAGKQFLWFLALNMKFMMNLRMEQSNRKSKNALELKRGIYTADEMLDELRMITASRKPEGFEYPRSTNIKTILMLLSYLGLQEPSTEAFSTLSNNLSVPLMPDKYKN